MRQSKPFSGNSIDMVTGPLLKNLLLFSLPLMATNILQLLFNAADVVVVGRYASYASLAAVGSTTAIVNLVVTLLCTCALRLIWVAVIDTGTMPVSLVYASYPASWFLLLTVLTFCWRRLYRKQIFKSMWEKYFKPNLEKCG